MNKAVDLLRQSNVFYLATMDGDQPRVRPFGAVADIDDKLYFATNNTKACYQQMIANPKVEISGMLGEDKWYRICGTVINNPRFEAKCEFLKQSPIPMYTADDGIFEVFYFEKATVTVSSFEGEMEKFEIS